MGAVRAEAVGYLPKAVRADALRKAIDVGAGRIELSTKAIRWLKS
jgi:hypothetical protein